MYFVHTTHAPFGGAPQGTSVKIRALQDTNGTPPNQQGHRTSAHSESSGTPSPPRRLAPFPQQPSRSAGEQSTAESLAAAPPWLHHTTADETAWVALGLRRGLNSTTPRGPLCTSPWLPPPPLLSHHVYTRSPHGVPLLASRAPSRGRNTNSTCTPDVLLFSPIEWPTKPAAHLRRVPSGESSISPPITR